MATRPQHYFNGSLMNLRSNSEARIQGIFSAQKVIDNLYIGDVFASQNNEGMHTHLITHILTVAKDIPPLFPTEFTYLCVEVSDHDSQDLLAYFDKCNEFIEKGRKVGGVLVHCVAGVSRSATVVIAYLMKSMKISLPEAIKILTSVRLVSPNIGFLHQLVLYESMGLTLEGDSEAHRTYRLIKKMKDLSREWKNKRNNVLLGMDPEEDEYPPLSTSSWSSTNSSTNSTDSDLANLRDNFAPSREVYVCTKCKRKLFFKSSVINHQLELKGCEALLQRTKIEPCDGLFVEMTKWMGPFDEDSNQGTLACPSCKEELGSWQLKPKECMCGCQMDPAFKILLAKVKLIEDCDNSSVNACNGVGSLPPIKIELEQTKQPTSATSPTNGSRKWSITNFAKGLSSSPPTNNGNSKTKPEKTADKSDKMDKTDKTCDKADKSFFQNLKKRSLTQ